MVKDINSGSGDGLLAAISQVPSQPIPTPSISEPTTDPTEANCGRADGTAAGTVMVQGHL